MWRRVGWLLGGVLSFGLAAGAGFAGVCRPPAWRWRVVRQGALGSAGTPAVWTGFGARLGNFARGLGGGVLDKDVVMKVDEAVVVVQVVELQAEETDVGDSECLGWSRSQRGWTWRTGGGPGQRGGR